MSSRHIVTLLTALWLGLICFGMWSCTSIIVRVVNDSETESGAPLIEIDKETHKAPLIEIDKGGDGLPAGEGVTVGPECVDDEDDPCDSEKGL